MLLKVSLSSSYSFNEKNRHTEMILNKIFYDVSKINNLR